MNRTLKAFTLVELLVVISIIVILISVMVVASGPIMHQAGITSCQTQLKTLVQCYLNYTNQYSVTFPPLQNPSECTTPPGKLPTYTYPNGLNTSGGPVANSNDNFIYNGTTVGYQAGFGPLAWQKLVAASYYVCPAVSGRDTWWHDGMGGNGDDYWMTNANSNPDTSIQQTPTTGAPTSIGSTTIIASYSIRPDLYRWTPAQIQMPRGGTPTSPTYPAYRAIIADTFDIYTSNTGNPCPCVTNRHKDGICVGYIDGTVGYCTNAFLTAGPVNAPPTYSSCGTTLENMWVDFDNAVP